MIEYNVRKGTSVRLPSNSFDWELYSMKGVGVASRDLTSALKRAIRHAKRALRKGPFTTERIVKALSDAYEAELYPVMRKHSDFGACDTEPRYDGKNAMIRAISMFLYGDKKQLSWNIDTWSF